MSSAINNKLDDLIQGADFLIDFAQDVKKKAMALRKEVSGGTDTSPRKRSEVVTHVLKTRRKSRLRK